MTEESPLNTPSSKRTIEVEKIPKGIAAPTYGFIDLQ
jgi:hypothetical protein